MRLQNLYKIYPFEYISSFNILNVYYMLEVCGAAMEKFETPKNLALIPDGNRRWANNHKVSIIKGYDLGIKKFIDFSIWLKDFGGETLTVWALSTENISNRSRTELNILYKLYIKAANDKKLLKTLKDNGVRINAIGNLNLIPAEVRRALGSIERKTKAYKKFTINILIAYGGREEILHAARKMISQKIHNKIKRIDEAALRVCLRTGMLPTPDLIIRTSGELRLSGFMPWQAGYAELYFSKKLWPDFTKHDLYNAISDCNRRERRFGK